MDGNVNKKMSHYMTPKSNKCFNTFVVVIDYGSCKHNGVLLWGIHDCVKSGREYGRTPFVIRLKTKNLDG